MGNNQAGATAGRAATRVVALVGPAGTGKTSLAEALLFSSGATSRQGSVEAGSSVGDASPEARARGGSTEINLMHFDYMGDHFALVDLPGGTGFAADGLAALQSADLALVVIDPAPERAMLAEPVLRRLDDLGVPHAIFVNKIEHARAGTIHSLISELQPMSREPLALRQIPIREGGQVVGAVDLISERAWKYREGQPSVLVEMPSSETDREAEARSALLEHMSEYDDHLLEDLIEDHEPAKAGRCRGFPCPEPQAPRKMHLPARPDQRRRAGRDAGRWRCRRPVGAWRQVRP
jgi:elongation factor G